MYATLKGSVVASFYGVWSRTFSNCMHTGLVNVCVISNH